MVRGSRGYFSGVMASSTLPSSVSVGSLQNGSSTAVVGSGMISMSLLLISDHPRIDDPSKPRPSSKAASSLNSEIGAEKCCHVPSRSMNLISTITTPLSFIICRTCLGVIGLTSSWPLKGRQSLQVRFAGADSMDGAAVRATPDTYGSSDAPWQFA